MKPFPPEETRQAISGLVGVAKSKDDLIPPEARRVYIALAHSKIFDWDTSIVVGMRGAGKSLWTAALTSSEIRKLIGHELRISFYENIDVKVAFGVEENVEQYPSGEILASLLGDFEPRIIWRSVVVREASTRLEIEQGNITTWRQWTEWTKNNPEEAGRRINLLDEHLHKNEKRLIFAFDSLERLSPKGDWDETNNLLQGALQVALSLRSTRAIRAKLFLRPDMYDDPTPWSFPEASKLRQTRVELAWSPTDLYGLIFHLLINDPSTGHLFRKIEGLQEHVESRPDNSGFSLRRGVSTERVLRPLVEAIAGQYMGSNRRRGLTFTWIPNHLADAQGRVSPRSFLLAFTNAAEASVELYTDYKFALHFKAIHSGVREASRVRKDEICKDDYPWVEPLLAAIRDLTFPCSPAELVARWDAATITAMGKAQKLPPRRYTTDIVRIKSKELLIDDLVELAVLRRTEDGRINMPDIYRVAAGGKRKGGVIPAR